MLNSITSPLDGIRSPFGAIRNPFAAYAIGGLTPQTIADFEADKYRANGTTSTAASLLTHTRAGTATYTDATGTLQTVASNVPRIGHHAWNGSAWVNEGLLHESGARTNLLTYSEIVDDTGWTDATSVSTNLSESVFGVFPGVSIASAGNDWNRLTASNVSVTSGVTYSFTLWAKAGTSNRIRVVFRDVTAAAETQLVGVFPGDTISNPGLTGSLSIYSQQNVGNNVTAIVLTFTPNFTGDLSIGVGPDSNVAGETIIAYGAQLEVGPTPSSYIPTSGATATRAAETLTIPAANLPWNPLAVSIQMDGRVTYADEDAAVTAEFMTWQTNTNNKILHFIDTSSTRVGEIVIQQAVNSVFDAKRFEVLTPGVLEPFNISARHATTFLNGAVDGIAGTVDETPTALVDLSSEELFLFRTAMGTIRTFRVWANDIGDTGIEEASS